MSFDWEDSDDKYAKYESSNEVSLSDIVYGFECSECGEVVRNSDFYGDPDSPVWRYECHDCELRYRVRPSKVTATVSEMGI